MKIIHASFLVLFVGFFFISLPAPAGTVLHVNGGRLHLSGGALVVDDLTVANIATVSGRGRVSGTGDIAGVMAPGVGEAIGTLHFGTAVTFRAGSVLECHVADTTSVDRLEALGPVTGDGQVVLIKVSGIPATGIPIDAVIADGNENSLYEGFVSSPMPSTNWGLAVQPVGDLVLTDLQGDSDSDRLPDWFEQRYWGDRTMAAPFDPTVDSDHDGVSNGGELAAGTDPRDSTSVLQLSLRMLTPAQALIEWPCPSNFWFNVPDRVYTLQRATNITVGFDWEQAVGANPLRTGYTNDLTGETKAFYRVEIR